MSVFNCNNKCDFSVDRNKTHLLHHIKHKIPTKIRDSETKILLPSRSDLLNHKTCNDIHSTITNGGQFIFMNVNVKEVNEYRNYNICMFGSLLCGTKVVVQLFGIPVYLDIECIGPYDEFSRKFNAWYECINDDVNTIIKKECVFLYPFNRFTTSKVQHLRVYFDNIWTRNSCVYEINKRNNDANLEFWRTSSDDVGDNGYFNKIAREYRLGTSTWNTVEKYALLPGSSNDLIQVKVNINNCKKIRKVDLARYMLPSNPYRNIIDKDNTLVCSWDIETYSNSQTGKVPTAKDDYTIFMICAAFFWHHSNVPLLTFCAVENDTDTHDGIDLTIVCANECNVMSAYISILGRMKPDIMSAYNGSNFDWPLCKNKIIQYKLISDFIQQVPCRSLTWNNVYDTVALDKYFKKAEKIKIDAENDFNTVVTGNIPGILDVDVLPTFMRMYPRAEVGIAASLNYFLKDNGLSTKEDMPYKTMFRIYERSRKYAKMNTYECHCSRQQECAICNDIVSELDCKSEIIGGDTVYNKELLDQLVNEDKTTKCCICGKYPLHLQNMAKVAYYCVIDCIRPHELCVKRMVYYDKRESSNLSYLPLRDSFYRADGVKVINTVGSLCYKLHIAFSNRKIIKSNSEKEHYPGAFVFPPNRGYHGDGQLIIYDKNGGQHEIHGRPLIPLDFTSLYPSLMMAYNFSTDTIIKTKEEADLLKSMGYSIYEVPAFDYEKGEKKGNPDNFKGTAKAWSVRHNGVINSTINNIIMGYKKICTINGKTEVTLISPDTVRDIDLTATSGSVIYEPVYGREKLSGERMGILAYAVHKIFMKRIPIKREYMKWAKIHETMRANKIMYNDELQMSIADVKFKMDVTDAKQKALKILSNTFYGQSGFFRSVIYDMLVAGSVTTSGQENIKKVAGIVQKLGFQIHYGDTDSIYLSCPENIYTECDEQYHLMSDKTHESRIKWWTDQVNITMNVANRLKEYISDVLILDNGTNFLNMTFDDIAYPILLCGKKKYFMISHIVGTVPNFNKKVEVKGIETKKQGRPNIIKLLGELFMETVVSPHNHKNTLEIANDIIDKYYTNGYNASEFKKTYRYKPDKNNVAVQTFVARMKKMCESYAGNHIMQSLYMPPEPGDKFECVIIKPPAQLSINGRLISYAVGDKMEYYRVYTYTQNTDNPMVIDYDHYMNKGLSNMIARFISYHPEFQPRDRTYDPHIKADFKIIDTKSINNASAYINEICKKYSNTNEDLSDKSVIYKAVYKDAKKIVTDKLNVASNKKIITAIKGDSNIVKVVNKILEDIDSTISPDRSSTIRLIGLLNSKSISVYELRKLYSRRGIAYLTKINAITKIKQGIINDLLNTASEVQSFTQKYNEYIENLASAMHEGKCVEQTYECDNRIFDRFNDILLKYKSIQHVYIDLCDFINYVSVVSAPLSIKYMPPDNLDDLLHE